MKSISLLATLPAVVCLAATFPVAADENLLGYVSGAETLPQGASEAYVWLTRRWEIGGGLSYRFAPNWNVGVETVYQTEFETEVGQERWSWFAGPTIHYGGKQWWATLTWFNQLAGGREQYINQADDDLHLIEKTKHELRLKLGYNFF